MGSARHLDEDDIEVRVGALQDRDDLLTFVLIEGFTQRHLYAWVPDEVAGVGSHPRQ